ncbi:putative microtubule-associated tumor suppressor 1 [Scophthalmus maximus]|uniref:Putative microtubule-associated tumor suppressor 1 n=1 Tax=Scophthalmus maximus TaxID=52904 RepID=A0A2U9C9Y2_SCOMX|nr:putative microtubule-associated tumor suppressor 1 [Scophthalmus maximus]
MSSDLVESTVPVPHRGLQLVLSPESHYSNSSTSPSPDSDSSFSNVSDRGASSSPDINMLECCLSQGSFVDNPYNSTLPQGHVFCGVGTNLNQTFIATPVYSSVNFWNKNLSPMSIQEMGSEKYKTFNKNTGDGSNTAGTSPDSAGRGSHLSSRETSRRGSTENDWFSLSSGEMVIRSNSFCLADQSLPVVSSLEDSSVSPAACHLALPAESDLLPPTLPDVCEKSIELAMDENIGHPRLGMTFTEADNWEIPAEENDLATYNSLLALPSENEGVLLQTFLCEPSSADSEKEAHVGSVEAELLAHFPGSLPAVQDSYLLNSSQTRFTIPKSGNHLSQTKPGILTGSQNERDVQAKATKMPAENSARAVKRISLVEESSTSTAPGSSLDESKSRFRLRPSPRQTRAAPPAISPRAATLSTRQRQATLGGHDCRTSKAVGTPQSKHKGITASQRGGPPLGAASAASIKPKLNGSQPPQTPTRSSLMGLPPTSASRLPRKTQGPSRSLAEANVHVSGGTANKQTPFKSVVLKARLISTTGKNTGKMDKNKPKASSRQQHPQQHLSQPNQSHGPPDVVPPSVAKAEKKDQNSQQLTGLLTASNCRFEALTIVLQQTLTKRDEATQRSRELSQELVNLRGDLVGSVRSSERLEKEKEDLRVSLEEALQKVQEQHRRDVAELEQRLQAFYQAEWDKVHLTYQEEADKCKTLMQQQMGELKANHEAMKLELQSSHAEQLQCVKQQHDMSLEELRNVHNQELQSLDKSLKDAEFSLFGQIDELTVENKALMEKLTAEETKRKALAEKSRKDPHTLYLEQELESLKVVLDIKNKQLHQQEKKLMEINKLTEKNVNLDENLKKVQQENEDLKARMERHAALSRQLSTEQTVLQESLHKESKVNKRLSMENEELLWKLHNGDLSSPRKVSPTSTSPSHSFSLQSPRGSAFFPSPPPVSPR